MAYAEMPGAGPPEFATAIASAKTACELTGNRHPHCLALLAAICARTGDLNAAVRGQERAVEYSTEEEVAAAKARLDLYQQTKGPMNFTGLTVWMPKGDIDLIRADEPPEDAAARR